MKTARIKYYEDFNGREGFAIEIQDIDGTFGLDTFFPCVRRENADNDEDYNFLHYGIVTKIKTLLSLGYSLT